MQMEIQITFNTLKQYHVIYLGHVYTEILLFCFNLFWDLYCPPYQIVTSKYEVENLFCNPEFPDIY